MNPVEVKPDRLEEFLAIIKVDAAKSRQNLGCIRFDVLQEKLDPLKFVFYEVYHNPLGFMEHFGTEQFKKYNAFVKSGGLTQTPTIMSVTDFSG